MKSDVNLNIDIAVAERQRCSYEGFLAVVIRFEATAPAKGFSELLWKFAAPPSCARSGLASNKYGTQSRVLKRTDIFHCFG